MAVTETLVVDLPAETVQSLRAKVATGEYRSESEAVAAAVEEWLTDAKWQAELDAAIDQGVAEADAGLGIPLEDVRRELLERFGAKAA